MSVSDYEAKKIEGERDRAESRLDRIKSEAQETGSKLLEAVVAVGTGFAVGAVNTSKGGTAQTPYSLGGKVPLDTTVAVGGLLLALFTRSKSKFAPVSNGIMGAGLGIYGARLGSSWESNRLGTAPAASTTPATTPTASGPIGFSRRLPEGEYGSLWNSYQNQSAPAY